jgi:hypothetical protein
MGNRPCLWTLMVADFPGPPASRRLFVRRAHPDKTVMAGPVPATQERRMRRGHAGMATHRLAPNGSAGRRPPMTIVMAGSDTSSRRLRTAPTKEMSGSLDTIINGQTSMFMAVNRGRFSRSASLSPALCPAHPSQQSRHGRACPGHPRTPHEAWPCRHGHPPARAEWIGGTSPADDGRLGWGGHIISPAAHGADHQPVKVAGHHY